MSSRRPTRPLHVLDGLDLDIYDGEFVCFLGPSGCGKSTLLNVVGGFLKPTAGRVLIDGEPVRAPTRAASSCSRSAASSPG